MPTIRTTVMPPTGLQLLDIDVTCFNRSGAARVVGDLVMFDMTQSATETAGVANDGSSGIFENAILPTTAGLECFPMGVVVSAGADDALIKVRVQGIVDAIVVGTTPVIGDRLYAVNAQDNLDVDADVTGRALGILLATTTAGSTGSVYFDGINGVGVGPAA